jgi:hypothetical protein
MMQETSPRFMAASELPFQWSEATIDPTPRGYVLAVPMNLDERATKLLEAVLPDLHFADLGYELYPQTRRDASSIEPGKLRISRAEFSSDSLTWPLKSWRLLHEA